MGYEYNVGAQIGFIFANQVITGLLLLTE